MSDEFESVGYTFNKHLTSSMKYSNLEYLSKEEIIHKYEELLYKRELQVKDIAQQIININDNYSDLSEQLECLSKINNQLKDSIYQDEKKLESERTSKDVLFVKWTNLINENNKLILILNNNTDANSFDKSKQIDTKDKSNDIIKSNTISYSSINSLDKKINTSQMTEKNNEPLNDKNNNTTNNTVKNGSNSNNESNPKKTKKNKKKEGKGKQKKWASESISYDPVFK